MDRRRFLLTSLAGALAAPLAAEAQQTAPKVYRIGILETTSQTLNAANVEALKLGLKELGYGEGRTSPSNIDPPTAGPNDSRISRASWFASTSISS